MSAIKHLGWDIEERKDLTFVKKKAKDTGATYYGYTTLNQILKKLDTDKKYIIILKDHVIAYVDGTVHDISNYGKKHYVHYVFEIVQK